VIVFDTNSNTFLTVTPRSLEVVFLSPCGEDADKFTINAKNGVVSMIARDYEKPVDKDKDNVYKVTIIATDGDKNTTSKDRYHQWKRLLWMLC
jgi:hypothetical protein